MPNAAWLDLRPQTEVWVVEDLLTPEACAAWLARAEAIGFDEAPLTTAAGPVRDPEVRNNVRAMCDDPDAAAALWALVRPFVPERWVNDARAWPSGGTWEAIGLNERLRLYRYGPGQYFAPHYDGAFERSAEEVSLFTFLVYLDDGCTGGETRFFRSVNGQWRVAFEVTPRAGTAVLFRHLQLHEGAPVVAGVKTALRSDVMCRRVR